MSCRKYEISARCTTIGNIRRLGKEVRVSDHIESFSVAKRI